MCGNLGLEMSNLNKYHNIHEGKTIFILGNSDELNSLTKEQINKLENDHVTIGVNYSHMVVSSNYMITGHMSHIVYAREYGKVGTMFFQTFRPNPVFDNVDNVETIFCDYGNGDTMQKGTPKVEGCANIGISVSHLAYLMGAIKVVYIGFNQKNLLHFYDTNKGHRTNILSNINEIKTKYRSQYPPALFADYDDHISHMLPEKELKEKHWTSRPNNSDNINIMTNMFKTINNNGVEVVSTFEDSIMTDSGATYKSLEEILNNE